MHNHYIMVAALNILSFTPIRYTQQRYDIDLLFDRDPSSYKTVFQYYRKWYRLVEWKKLFSELLTDKPIYPNQKVCFPFPAPIPLL